MIDIHRQFVAFEGTKMLARGPLEEVVTEAKARLDRGTDHRIAIFPGQLAGRDR